MFYGVGVTAKMVEKESFEGVSSFTTKEPGAAVVLSNKLLTHEKSDDEVRHIVFRPEAGRVKFSEGQSLGIIVPAHDKQKHHPRLYTIASSRYGDEGDAGTISLCVKRVVYNDPVTGELKRGVASNYLCDLNVGDRVAFMGPAGKKFLLPKDPSTRLIMIGVGTGIAPFRSFAQCVYARGRSWTRGNMLFFGAKTQHECLYLNDQDNSLAEYVKSHGLKIYLARSREEKNSKGEKMYVQHRIAENMDSIWQSFMDRNFALYICGLKGVEKGVDEGFAAAASSRNCDWAALKEEFKNEGRWNVEVY